MKKELFKRVFHKVEEQTGKGTKNAKVNFLSDVLLEFQVSGSSSRNLLRYYEKYIEGVDDPINPKIELLDALSNYLGHENYEDFVCINDIKEENIKTPETTHIYNQFGKNNLIVKSNNGEITLS